MTNIRTSDIMQPDVYCAVSDMPVRELYKDLLAHEITGAPVLDANDYLVGVVSVSDVARCVAGVDAMSCEDYYSNFNGKNQSAIAETEIAQTQRVADIMTQRIHQVAIDSSLEEVLDVIIEEDIHRVIVTHRGHVVGIVTAGDLLRTFREFLQSQRSTP